jgi:flagellar biosynthesis GTPase FlhF
VWKDTGDVPVIISTKIWAERILLMRVETLKARKTEESERLRKREEEAREQSERLWMREEEAREQSERLWKREEEAREQEEEAREQRERLRKKKESEMSSYSAVIQESLLQRNRVRDRVLPAEQLRAYIKLGQWGDVLQWKVSMCIL